MLRETTMRWIPSVVESSVRRNIIASQYPSMFKAGLGKWLSADTWLFPKFLKDRGRLLNGSVGLVQERIDGKESIEGRDIMSYLLAAKDPETGESLSIEEVRSESFLMLSAGEPKTIVSTKFVDTDLLLGCRRRYNLHSNFSRPVLSFT